jgi:hypothetical protein
MSTPKQSKAAIIAAQARKILELESQLAHVYHFAHRGIDKASVKHRMGSGVLLQLSGLGGKEIILPVMIRDGLSDETIAAIKADLVRSYAGAVEFKP